MKTFFIAIFSVTVALNALAMQEESKTLTLLDLAANAAQSFEGLRERDPFSDDKILDILTSFKKYESTLNEILKYPEIASGNNLPKVIEHWKWHGAFNKASIAGLITFYNAQLITYGNQMTKYNLLHPSRIHEIETYTSQVLDKYSTVCAIQEIMKRIDDLLIQK